MTSREALWKRRLELEHRSAVLRDRLAVHGQALRPVVHGAQRVQTAGRWLAEHPWVPALAAAVLVLRRPRKALLGGWWVVRKGWKVWRMAQTWRRWV